MSDHYLALVDPKATAAEAGALAWKIFDCLHGRGLIEAELTSDRVFGGQGYPAGSKCRDAYKPRRHEIAFWECQTNGVEIHSKLWINLWGFDLLGTAACPRCGHVHKDGKPDGDAIVKAVVAKVEDAMDAGPDWRVPIVACRACKVRSSLHDWTCDVHLGFVNLAAVFWNWADFDARGWKVKIPALLGRELGRPLITTYGRI